MTIEEITKMCCEFTGIKPEDIHANTRRSEIVLARQLAHYIAKHNTKLTLREIGYQIGRKDHTTVLHSIKVIDDYLTVESPLQNRIREFIIYAERITDSKRPAMIRILFKDSDLSKERFAEVKAYFNANPDTNKVYFIYLQNDETKRYKVESAAMWLNQPDAGQLKEVIDYINKNELVKSIEFYYKEGKK